MATQTTRLTPRAHIRHAGYLWALAILLWGVADVVVTAYGLNGRTVETHPAYSTAVGLMWGYGPWDSGIQIIYAALVIWKTAAIAAMYLGYRIVDRLMPRYYALGIPTGLALWGLFVFVWNLKAVGIW